MSDKKPAEVLVHPVHGRIPARRLLQCVFALSPAGPILHHHLEEVDRSEDAGTIVYTMNGCEPGPQRYRCQVIPPLVPQFPAVD
jgi:hypothetical protein